MTAEAEIRALIERHAAALRAKDATALRACGDESIVVFSLAPPLVTPNEGEGLERWFATWDGPLGFENRNVVIFASGDVAFAHCVARLSGKKIGEGDQSLWFRRSLGFRKLNGEWKTVHDHESVPFYMDGSFKAALDLQP